MIAFHDPLILVLSLFRLRYLNLFLIHHHFFLPLILLLLFPFLPLPQPPLLSHPPFLFASLSSVSNDEGTQAPGSGDIPQDLSADDEPLFVPTAIGADSAAAVAVGVNAIEPPLMITGDTAALVVEVLKELDKDYMSLRSRLVSLIEQQAPREVVRSHSVLSLETNGDGLEKDTLTVSDSVDSLSEAESRYDSSSQSAPAQAAENVSKQSSESGSAVGTRIKYWPSRQLVSN
jgi:hypothetical protein